VAKLEKILKRAVILRDIAGKDIYNSGKYQFGGICKVELIYHNGHAWPKDLHFPQSREVHIYDGDVWQAIQDYQEATQGEPLAVWLLGSQNKLLTVDQFMIPERSHVQDTGSPRDTQRLQKVCAKLGDESIAEKAFGNTHAASIMAKEKSGWKPTPASLLDDIQKACVEHGHGGLWNSMDYDTAK